MKKKNTKSCFTWPKNIFVSHPINKASLCLTLSMVNIEKKHGFKRRLKTEKIFRVLEDFFIYDKNRRHCRGTGRTLPVYIRRSRTQEHQQQVRL